MVWGVSHLTISVMWGRRRLDSSTPVEKTTLALRPRGTADRRRSLRSAPSAARARGCSRIIFSTPPRWSNPSATPAIRHITTVNINACGGHEAQAHEHCRRTCATGRCASLRRASSPRGGRRASRVGCRGCGRLHGGRLSDIDVVRQVHIGKKTYRLHR